MRHQASGIINAMSALPPVQRWEVSSPRGLVHIVHGMAEYGARYARLAAALNAAGLTVWAHDHCGHGDHMSVDGGSHLPGHFGDRGGWERLLDDTARVSQALQASSPGTPLLLFAHSMGSFVAQASLGSPAIAIGGGPVRQQPSSGPARTCGVGMARAERQMRGPRTPSRWLQRVVFGTYNRPFAPNRTEVDWLSRDAAEVDAYVADPPAGSRSRHRRGSTSSRARARSATRHTCSASRRPCRCG